MYCTYLFAAAAIANLNGMLHLVYLTHTCSTKLRIMYVVFVAAANVSPYTPYNSPIGLAETGVTPKRVAFPRRCLVYVATGVLFYCYFIIATITSCIL